MIGPKEAAFIARDKAAEMLDADPSKARLEEIERHDYKGRDVWFIILSLPRDLGRLEGLAYLAADPIQYKVFLIDAATGELVAVKMRDPVSQ